MKKIIALCGVGVIGVIGVIGIVVYMYLPQQAVRNGVAYTTFQQQVAAAQATLAAETAQAQLAAGRAKLTLERETAQNRLTVSNLQRWETARLFAVVSIIATGVFLAVVVGAGTYRRLSTHIIRTKNAVIPIKHSDLSRLAPEITTGLILAEQIEAQAPAKAFELYATLAEANTKQIHALIGNRGLFGKTALPELMAGEQPDTHQTVNIPTFAELLQQGELAPGKPMILAYQDGRPRFGGYEDIYSSAIAGESGSGKTSTELFLIASGVLTGQAKYFVVDPHYPHPKSLGAKLKPLTDAKLINFAGFYDDMLRTFQSVNDIIDARLKGKDTDTIPVVLVLDEVTALSKSENVSKPMFALMEKISTEGRKTAVYMLASAQTWLTVRTGGNSVVRDTLTSAYVHRIKPKQANALLQDGDESKKVRQFIKSPGDCLFIPVGSDPIVAKIPFTDAKDMQAVVNMVVTPKRNRASQDVQQSDAVISTPITPPPIIVTPSVTNLETVGISAVTCESLQNEIATFLKENQMSLTKFSEACGVNKGLLSAYLKGEKKLSEDMTTKVTAYLNTPKKIVTTQETGNKILAPVIMLKGNEVRQ